MLSGKGFSVISYASGDRPKYWSCSRGQIYAASAHLRAYIYDLFHLFPCRQHRMHGATIRKGTSNNVMTIPGWTPIGDVQLKDESQPYNGIIFSTNEVR